MADLFQKNPSKYFTISNELWGALHMSNNLWPPNIDNWIPICFIVLFWFLESRWLQMIEKSPSGFQEAIKKMRTLTIRLFLADTFSAPKLYSFVVYRWVLIFRGRSLILNCHYKKHEHWLNVLNPKKKSFSSKTKRIKKNNENQLSIEICFVP